MAIKAYNNDTDILARPDPMVGHNAAYTLPESSMYLPQLASLCECELAVNDEGFAMVLFNRPLPDGVHWVDYDIDLSLLTLVMWSGAALELGMKVHKPFRRYLAAAKEIMMVEMSEDGRQVVTAYPADLVIRHIGI